MVYAPKSRASLGYRKAKAALAALEDEPTQTDVLAGATHHRRLITTLAWKPFETLPAAEKIASPCAAD